MLRQRLIRDTSNILGQRLIRDIAELQARPYPNISLVLRDDDITKACLILTPNGDAPIHLTMDFGDQYPLSAPTISIQSEFAHPNVYGSYICASILNTDEGYTPAYTLKGIAIQLLSFFGSDKVEQIGTGVEVELAQYQRNSVRNSVYKGFHCPKCTFGMPTRSN